MNGARTELTLGPNLFNWAPETWRDFYFRIADEAPVSVVYLGETICSKRAPLLSDYYEAVSERLGAAGKTVVHSTLGETASRTRSPAGQRCLRENVRSDRGKRRIGGVPSARAASLHRPADERL